MVKKSRTIRIADRIREELSEILIFEIQDPRLAGVSVTDVTVDRELAFANIYYSCLEGSERVDDIQAGFQSARGYLRRELARRIELRTFPDLRFHWDPTFERAERIEQLFASLNSESSQDTSQDEDTE